MKKKTSISVVEKIKREKRQPRAAWKFRAKNWLAWTLAIAAVVAAGVLLSTILQEIFAAEWRAASRFPGGRFEFFRETISFLWLGSLVVVTTLAFAAFRKTKRGYRFGAAAVAGVLAVAGLSLAASFQQTHVPERLHDFHEQYFGREIIPQEWNDPKEGRLFGEIETIADKRLSLRDESGKVWKVDFSEVRLPPALVLEDGKMIRVIGEPKEEGFFQAEFLLPDRPPRDGRGRGKPFSRRGKMMQEK